MPQFIYRGNDLKRAVRWILILVVVTPLFFVGLAILAPRLINQEAIKNRIETAVSRELGGQIQYEHARLTIFPRPQVVISRLSVSIPGSVAGTSDSLNVTFRLLPLFVGRAQLADVRLTRPDVTLMLEEAPAPQEGAAAEPSPRSLASILGWLAGTIPNLALRIDHGRLVFTRAQERVFALDDTEIQIAASPGDVAAVGTAPADSAPSFLIAGWGEAVLEHPAFPGPVRLSIGAFEARPNTLSLSDTEVQALDAEASVSGRIDGYLTPHPSVDVTITASSGGQLMEWVRTETPLPEELVIRKIEVTSLRIAAPLREAGANFVIAGGGKAVLEHPDFPGPVRLSIRALEARPKTLTLSDAHVQTLDAEATLSGRLDDYLTRHPGADVTGTGSAGPEAMAWVRTETPLPEELLVRTPLSVSSTHVVWKADGTARVKGSASVARDVAVTFNVQHTPDRFAIDELTVRDRDSKASFTMQLQDRVLRLSFTGQLAQSTLTRVFEQEHVKFGSLTGDLQTQIVLDRPRDSTAKGRLVGDRLVLPLRTPVPVFIDRVVAQATEGTVEVDPLVITIDGSRHTVRGQISSTADRWLLDLNVDRLAWETIAKFFRSEGAGSDATGSEPAPDAKPQPVRATIRASAGTFTAGRWTAEPARADIVIGPEPPHITVHEAVVCGISVAGSATISGDATRIAITSSTKGEDLGTTLTCLVGKPVRVSGTFDASGDLDSTGTGNALVENLNGTVALSVKGGRFHADSVVVRIFSYLNLTDLLRGSFPDPGAQGIPYKSLAVRGGVQQGRLLIDEAVLDSSVAKMAMRGSLDLGKQTFDVTVLVAPLTSVDAVVKRIPVLREILAGSLVTIPVRVTGPFDDPKVNAVPPAAVASELGGIMQRTLKLPFKIIAPVIPGGKKGKEGEGGTD